MGAFIDLTGQRFGKLTVLERRENKGTSVCWLCRCDCGNEKIIHGSALRSGLTKSCGCIRREGAIKPKYMHGEEGSRLYRIWGAMKARCNNPHVWNYKHYGAKGVRVCEEWNNSFVSFRDWSMKNGYSDNLTIDRIDPKGNYEPGNCRWATWKEQQNNKRDKKDQK